MRSRPARPSFVSRRTSPTAAGTTPPTSKATAGCSCRPRRDRSWSTLGEFERRVDDAAFVSFDADHSFDDQPGAQGEAGDRTAAQPDGGDLAGPVPEHDLQ